MNLKRLTINQLPGIDQPFGLEASGSGIQIIFGPNGIGKSSVCRAVAGLYWGDWGASRKTFVSGEFEWGGEIWRAEREASSVRWSGGDESRTPPSLPAAHNYHCFFLQLRDLLDPSPDSARDIAEEIQRQLTGGFDLDQIAAGIFSPVPSRRKRSELRKFNNASNDVQSVELGQEALHKHAGQLDQLESQLEEAKSAEDRRIYVGRAIELAKRREELAGIEQRLGAMPHALAKLTGKEGDEVQDCEERLVELRKRGDNLETELQTARSTQRECGIDLPLDDADLEIWTNGADRLERLELELGPARRKRKEARRKLLSAVDAVGGDLIDNAALTLPNHSELFDYLRSSHSLATQIGETSKRLSLLEGIDQPEDSEQVLDSSRDASDALRSWLRTPQPESLAVRLSRRWRWLAAAFVMFLVGLGLAYFLDPLLASIAALGAGMGLAALFVRDAGDSNRRRQEAQNRYKEVGLEEPAEWNVSAVGDRLRNLESKTASLQRSRDRSVERELAQNELNGLREQQNELDVRRQKLKATLGLEHLPPDAELVDFARALDQLRLVCGENAAATGNVQDLESDHAGQLAELADILERYGESRPADAAAVKARLNNLRRRNDRLARALEGEKEATRQLEENGADMQSTRTSMARIYTEAELEDGDSHGLSSLLAVLPGFQELTKQAEDLESKNELDYTQLEKADESELAERDGLFLERLDRELEEIASHATRLHEEIVATRNQVKEARKGQNLQNLIAVRENARSDLGDLRDRTLFADAGDFLVSEIEQEYEQNRMPRVFERAREHFAAFTFHNYELHVAKGGFAPAGRKAGKVALGSRLFAEDLRLRQRRELDELSDGTRAQLLLAARIAFAEEAEQGRVLPLFLDEALDQSDPQRFEAIARSLGRIAHEQGRQIFYLTSDPLDVDRIRHALSRDGREPATIIDLGLIRTGVESVSGPEALSVSPALEVSSPDGLTPEAYGALLRVPAFRPALGFAEQHFFYLLWEDLALLRDLLTSGIERAGQWKTVAGTALAKRLASRSITAEQVGLRLELMEVFCELWKQGRGRPVDRDALADSGALSGRYLDDVVEIARELDGDAELLLGALGSREDERLKGFRSNSVERLRNYLIEHEYLDDRPVLAENELRLRCMASPAANHLPEGVAAEFVRRWWEWSRAPAVEEPKAGLKEQTGR